jgi:CheY-like chemotaxis protein
MQAGSDEAMLMTQRESYKPLVLCVDDNEAILNVTKMALEDKGYRVLAVNNGAAALETFAACAIDAVILDYEMPGMNGGQVALEMKRINPNVPKMLFSSCGSIPSEETKVFQDYCAKPASLRTLMAHVSELTSYAKSA